VSKAALHEHATAVPAIDVAAVAAVATPPPPTAPISEVSKPAPAVPAVTPPGIATPPVVTLKTRKNETHQKYIDVSVAKKKLFPNPQKFPPSRQQIGWKSFSNEERRHLDETFHVAKLCSFFHLWWVFAAPCGYYYKDGYFTTLSVG
jgi:hypothetical protein